MKLNPATVGPIVGHTTPALARIFLRGQAELVDEGVRRCFAAIRYRKQGAEKWSQPRFNKMSPNFDMTCVFVLEELHQDTHYEYQAGWFFADASFDAVEKWTGDQIEWTNMGVYQFKTASGDDKAARSFVVGSCRYLLRLFGGTIFDDRGDKAFLSIAEQIGKKRPVDALLMIGDQIYADDLNILLPDVRLDEFLRRYRIAFAQKHIQHLMSMVPTYMILDDHEIEDNWPAKSTGKDRVTIYPHAIHAYQIYQCSHSPLFDVVEGRIDGTLTHFWYSFSDGCADWFVLDARTERNLQPGLRRMIGQGQMDALLQWLGDGSKRIKFVVSSVPVFPDVNGEMGDKWGGFPEQRLELLEYIRKNRIRKVVFVSGDVHCSFVSELTEEGDPDFRVHSIVSSSFFWPYPHTGQSEFVYDKPLVGTGNASYRTKRLSQGIADDNFARIDAEPGRIKVTYYARKGEQIGKAVTLKF